MIDTLVSADVLEEFLGQLEERLREHARWSGVRPEEVRLNGRTVLDEFRVALSVAREGYVSTGKASRLTGWPEQTLRRQARTKLGGRKTEAKWADLQVRRRGRVALEFLASSIPPRRALEAE